MQPTPPQWPDQPPQFPQPPTPGGRPAPSRSTLILGIVSVVSAVLIVALIGTLIVVLQRGAQSGVSSGGAPNGAAAAQTATMSSVQATSTTEGTPATSGNSGTGSGGTQSTPTPKPTTTPAGPPSVQILSNHLTGKSNSPVKVSCPKGELALSGGWTSTARNLPITFSKRSGNGWQVLIDTTSVGLIPTTTAYVVCLQHVSNATVTERKAIVTVPPNTDGTADASCNPGEVFVGGGLEDSGMALYGLGPNLYFQVSGINDMNMSQSLTAYAECLHATGAKTTLVNSPIRTNVDPGASAGLQATCPNGGLIAGGNFGVDTTGGGTVYDYSPSNSSTWRGHFVNLGTTTRGIRLYPLCLSFS